MTNKILRTNNLQKFKSEYDKTVLTKTNSTEFTPTADYQPATKKYVDDNITGQDMSGFSKATNLENGKAEGSLRSKNAIKEGSYTLGSNAVALGRNTKASGNNSLAEGYNADAAGGGSHAEGSNTVASGEFSHVEGLYTKASSNYQHVQGKYNIEDASNRYAHIVGNGTTNIESNAHTIDWNGNAWFAGDIFVGGTDQDTGVKLLKSGDVYTTGTINGSDSSLAFTIKGLKPGMYIGVNDSNNPCITYIKWDETSTSVINCGWCFINIVNASENMEDGEVIGYTFDPTQYYQVLTRNSNASTGMSSVHRVNVLSENDINTFYEVNRFRKLPETEGNNVALTPTKDTQFITKKYVDDSINAIPEVDLTDVNTSITALTNRVTTNETGITTINDNLNTSYYRKSEVNSLIDAISGLNMSIVSELPDLQDALENTIYLVSKVKTLSVGTDLSGESLKFVIDNSSHDDIIMVKSDLYEVKQQTGAVDTIDLYKEGTFVENIVMYSDPYNVVENMIYKLPDDFGIVTQIVESSHDVSLITDASPNNIYNEYILINNSWEIIGSTEINLSDYYKKTEVDNIVSGLTSRITALETSTAAMRTELDTEVPHWEDA